MKKTDLKKLDRQESDRDHYQRKSEILDQAVKRFKGLRGGQIRAARALLDWTQTDLAYRAGVSLATIRRVEKSDWDFHATIYCMLRVVKLLEKHGVEFIEADFKRDFAGGVALRLVGLVDTIYNVMPSPKRHRRKGTEEISAEVKSDSDPTTEGAIAIDGNEVPRITREWSQPKTTTIA